MKKLIAITAIVALSGCAGMPTYEYCDSYAKVGAGYILAQPDIEWNTGNTETSPISARFEIGCEEGAVTYGVAHYSQWLEGAPFNSNDEPHRTEVFIDYKFD